MKYTYTLLIFSTFWFACTRETEITIPAEASKLVINGYFSPDSTWKIKVNKTIGILDSSRNIPPISNALVVISSDNSTLNDTLSYVNGVYISAQKPKIGQLYTLKVEVKGFPSVTASDKIPMFPAELSGRLDVSSKVILNSVLLIPTEYHPLPITLKDTVSEHNFYKCVTNLYDKNWLKTDSIRREANFERQSLTSQDPSVLRFHQEQDFMLFDDKLFANNVRNILGLAPTSLFYPNQISLGIPLESQKRNIEVYLDTWSMSENMYLYEKSYYTQQFNRPDPFSEPNNIFTNVKNGYGIFAGYQRKKVRVF